MKAKVKVDMEKFFKDIDKKIRSERKTKSAEKRSRPCQAEIDKLYGARGKYPDVYSGWWWTGVYRDLKTHYKDLKRRFDNVDFNETELKKENKELRAKNKKLRDKIKRLEQQRGAAPSEDFREWIRVFQTRR